jgi:hypothetical protein
MPEKWEINSPVYLIAFDSCRNYWIGCCNGRTRRKHNRLCDPTTPPIVQSLYKNIRIQSINNATNSNNGKLTPSGIEHYSTLRHSRANK